jgi:hypothetical protein
LSRRSSLIHISRDGLNGNIWIQNGDIVDAATANLTGEEAFQEILSWKGGNFEILPADPGRARAIHVPLQGLLPDSAQATAKSKEPPARAEPDAERPTPGGAPAGLAALGRIEGAGFLLAIPPDDQSPVDCWNLENSGNVAAWARDTLRRLSQLGDALQAGEVAGALGLGLQEQWALGVREQKGLLCAGFQPGLSAAQVEQTMKNILDKWAS